MGTHVSIMYWDDAVFEPVLSNPIIVGTDVAVDEALALDPGVKMKVSHIRGVSWTEEVSTSRYPLAVTHCVLIITWIFVPTTGV